MLFAPLLLGWEHKARRKQTRVVRVPRRVFQRLLPERPTPERCVEACCLQRARFERIAEPMIRRRQLTGEGKVETRVEIC